MKRFLLFILLLHSLLSIDAQITKSSTKKPLATLATTSRKTSRYLLFGEKQDHPLCGWRNVKTNEQKGIFESNQGF